MRVSRKKTEKKGPKKNKAKTCPVQKMWGKGGPTQLTGKGIGWFEGCLTTKVRELRTNKNEHGGESEKKGGGNADRWGLNKNHTSTGKLL